MEEGSPLRRRCGFCWRAVCLILSMHVGSTCADHDLSTDMVEDLKLESDSVWKFLVFAWTRVDSLG